MGSLTPSIDVIILSGQSNMAGRGGLTTKLSEDGTTTKEWDGAVPLECQVEQGTILRLSVDLEWENAQEPLHFDIDTGKPCGLGPGLVFASSVIQSCKAMGKMPVPVLGLVPCAIGGTSIKEWEKGSPLYEQMIRRVRAAVDKGGVLRALLWYQGESDTLSEDLARDFRRRLEIFIANVRCDLQSENLPFIQVGITADNHPHPHFVTQIREAQLEINLPRVYYVDAHGLPLQEDRVHLTSEAQVQLGKMLADVYLKYILRPAGDSEHLLDN
ncbi:hypothetical protein O6H91_01G132600 [Diphasiastrum complanatum]|uniref:Uncharacterized protein n=2 Tax=Diphasiastrum complanatum TaxID=34168 RepID=A0ACC2EW53_DIPCM|nr:hypothetical protein O6H91_01G132600 [Diphasiastrum complanatum]KAJ7570708.1 hypothetical protein O6H91_01G132600 [Diphasiastrum complanatum]